MATGFDWLPEPATMGYMNLDPTVIGHLVLFLVMYAFLSKVVIKPYAELVEKRDHLTAGTKEASLELHARAEEAMQQHEAALQKARLEAAELREKLRREGQQEEGEVVEQARASAQSELEASRAERDRQIQAARADLAARADELSGEIARKVLATGRGGV